MGRDLLQQQVPGVREMYDRASHALGYDLLRVCLEGPKEMLDQVSDTLSKHFKDILRFGPEVKLLLAYKLQCSDSKVPIVMFLFGKE